MKTTMTSVPTTAPVSLYPTKVNGIRSKIATTIFSMLFLMALSLGLHSQAVGQTLEVGRDLNGVNYNGGAMKLKSTDVYHFHNNTNKKITSLKFTFDPINGANGKTTGNGDIPWFDPKKVKIDKGMNGDVTAITFTGMPYIGPGGDFLIDATSFPNRTITMTAILGPQLVRLEKSASPELGTSGVDYVSIRGSAFPAGDINAANVVVELAATCEADASAATAAASIVNGPEGAKLLSFLLPSGLDAGRYSVSVSDSRDRDANFESRNCSEVAIAE